MHTPRTIEPRRIHGRSLLSAGLSYTAYMGAWTGATPVVTFCWTGYVVVVVCWSVDASAGEELMVWMLLMGIVVAAAMVAEGEKGMLQKMRRKAELLGCAFKAGVCSIDE